MDSFTKSFKFVSYQDWAFLPYSTSNNLHISEDLEEPAMSQSRDGGHIGFL